MIVDWTAVGSFATALTVGAAAVQIYFATRQEKTEFEDSLAREYREIIARLPLEVLLQRESAQEKVDECFPLFYRYVDLCNEQVFLRRKRRIRKSTWDDWRSGIQSNLQKAGYRQAWERIKGETASFDELRWLEETRFRVDPVRMPKRLPRAPVVRLRGRRDPKWGKDRS